MSFETAVALVVFVLAGVSAGVLGVLSSRMRDLRTELEYERRQREVLREEYRAFYWDMHRAIAAMGLKKMPGHGPTWVKE